MYTYPELKLHDSGLRAREAPKKCLFQTFMLSVKCLELCNSLKRLRLQSADKNWSEHLVTETDWTASLKQDLVVGSQSRERNNHNAPTYGSLRPSTDKNPQFRNIRTASGKNTINSNDTTRPNTGTGTTSGFRSKPSHCHQETRSSNPM
ncbi:hypothetical protein RRG08_003289 [Elysia crispata]|uniref:Uncharacterized protein n=1 Tax=Elysia crispata TaxID=231223 RepID=A0AAE1D0M5_9GAST|nr:hypothetical protein RRG08_003289 [Elysia crispata]